MSKHERRYMSFLVEGRSLSVEVPKDGTHAEFNALVQRAILKAKGKRHLRLVPKTQEGT